MNRAFSTRSNRSAGPTSPTSRKAFSFSSLRESIQPELSRKLHRLIKSVNNLVLHHEAAGKEQHAIGKQLSEWGENSQDESVSDISDKIGVILSAIGEIEEGYAHDLEEARGLLKAIRDTEKSVQPARDSKEKIADEIQKLKFKDPTSTHLGVLEQELVRAEAQSLVADAQLSNVTREKFKQAYDAEFTALIERSEKQILIAKHGRRLLALLDDSPVTPGDAPRPFKHGRQARQVLDDANDDVNAWKLSLDDSLAKGAVRYVKTDSLKNGDTKNHGNSESIGTGTSEGEADKDVTDLGTNSNAVDRS